MSLAVSGISALNVILVGNAPFFVLNVAPELRVTFTIRCLVSVAEQEEQTANTPFFSERMFQKYRTYEKNFFLNERDLLFTSYGDIVSIEIKQNKEDMEENNAKHSNSESIGRNLKPFDLEAARSGKPVCTRDGRKARIICFDVKAKKPIAALITNDDTEEVHFYYDNGRSDQYLEYRYDLMMLPEKKEGWVNVYKGGLLDTKSYPTKKEAFDKACPEGYIDTIKISWEE